MLYTLLIVLFVLDCLILIISVLMQAGKGGGLAGAFGGGAMSQAVFGGRGAATFLSKLTTGSAIVYFLLAIAIAVVSKPTQNVAAQKSLISEEVQQATEATPAETGTEQGTAPTEAIPLEAPAPGQTATPTEAPAPTEQPPPTEQGGQ